MALVLKEAERRAYLQALGVVEYLPRQLDCDAMAEQAVVEVGAPGSVADQVPTEADHSQEVALPESAPDQCETLATQPAETIRFSFLWVHTAANMSLLIEAADPEIAELSAQEHRLLANILRALGLDIEAQEKHFFCWPLVNNPKIPQGQQEALDSLLAYTAESVTGEHLLLLGELPANFFIPASAAADTGASRYLNLRGRKLSLIELPSLSAMLGNWKAKALTWQRIAHLQQNLPL